jgi:hypothetical protein
MLHDDKFVSSWIGSLQLFSQLDLPGLVFLSILVTITSMLMIGKHNHPIIYELVLEAGLGTLVISLHVLMSFFFESHTIIT